MDESNAPLVKNNKSYSNHNGILVLEHDGLLVKNNKSYSNHNYIVCLVCLVPLSKIINPIQITTFASQVETMAACQK